MSIFIQFITNIFKKWFIYLSLIPTIYDLFDAYFEFSFKFPKFFIIGFPILVFVYAIYSVYKDEYKKRELLEKRLEGPTDYEVKAVLKPIDFDKERYHRQVDNVISKCTEELTKLSLEKDESKEADMIIGVLYGSDKSYQKRLKPYADRLQKTIDKTDEYKDNISQKVEELNDKFYRIDFFIKNVGITSDTEIQVDLICLNDNIVFKEIEISEYDTNIDKLVPKIPEHPKVELEKFMEQLESKNQHLLHGNLISSHHDFIPRNLYIPKNPNTFRKRQQINKHQCSVTIRDLHVGDMENLFDENIILLKENENIEFKITIKSKQSTRVLHPKVIVEYTKNKILLFKDD